MKVFEKRDISGSGKWIKLVELDYYSDEKVSKWEMVERTTKPLTGIDGTTLVLQCNYSCFRCRRYRNP